MNRRDFLKTFAVSAAALGLGAVPVAEGEPAPDTLLGVPIEWTDLDEPETVLLELTDGWRELFEAYCVPVGPPVEVDGQLGYLVPPELWAELIEKIKADLPAKEPAPCA